ncbi:hypothetical protein ACFLTE_05405, partial [Bacteroidota bacterium]
FYPSVNYNLTQRFSINFGIVQLNQIYNNFLQEDSPISQFNPYSTFVVGSGNYLINNKLSLYTKLVKQVDGNGINYSVNPALQNYSFGINYNILPNLNVGVEFRQIDDNYYYPFY